MESNNAAPNQSVAASGLPAPDWMQKMRDDYRQNRAYRAEDVRRLLGDPTQGVGSNPATPQQGHVKET
jgi:hypothetical protein